MSDVTREGAPAGNDRRLSVVIPAFNEANGIGPTLEGLRLELPAAEIIVVDDGSNDGTADVVAKHCDVVLLRHAFRRGYGASLKTGMAAATREYVAWFDADNEHRVSDLMTMFARIEGEGLAAIIAQRRYPGPSAVRGLGKFVIRLLARSLGFKGEKDMNCGLRVFDTDIITRYMPLLPNSFSASLTSTMVMLERGYPVGYQTIELNPRIGTSKVTLGDGFTSLLLVVRVIMLFSPMRIFFPTAAVLLATGGVYSAWVAFTVERGLPVLGAFLMLTGVVIFTLGLIADQLSQLRLSQYEATVPRRRQRLTDLPAGMDALNNAAPAATGAAPLGETNR